MYVLALHTRHAHRHQEKTSDLLELELQAVVGQLRWVLGTKLRPYTRATIPLNCSVMSPDPQ